MQALAHLHAAYPFWLWGGVAAALLAIEVMTGSGWLLWAAASAALTAGAAQLGGLSPAPTILLFAVLTIVSTLAARRFLPKPADAGGGDINDSVARLMGQRGRAVAAFDGRFGRVMVDGKEWAAELDGDGSLAADAPVEVVAVGGARLRVRAILL
jgi:membrane protein implicated in regulation of membrane protease activity